MITCARVKPCNKAITDNLIAYISAETKIQIIEKP